MTALGTSMRLLTVGEVADLFHVNPKTVTRWRETGKIKAKIRTPGGHYRYAEEEILGFLGEVTPA